MTDRYAAVILQHFNLLKGAEMKRIETVREQLYLLKNVHSVHADDNHLRTLVIFNETVRTDDFEIFKSLLKSLDAVAKVIPVGDPMYVGFSVGTTKTQISQKLIEKLESEYPPMPLSITDGNSRELASYIGARRAITDLIRGVWTVGMERETK